MNILVSNAQEERKMNDIIINIISVVVTSIVLPTITFLGIKLTSWLNTKIPRMNVLY